jgi:hypothetical protein
MTNRYHGIIRQLMSPILPEGYQGFMKARLGQCSTCQERCVVELPFFNGDQGEVHLCQRYRKELGLEDGYCATHRRCRDHRTASEGAGHPDNGVEGTEGAEPQ